MLKQIWLAIVVLLVASSVVSGTIPGSEPLSTAETAMENEAPLADAGLDQEVRRGAAVLLDGTGSRDPDGQIDDYNWSIRTPDGGTVTPDCVGCARTAFTPTEVGEYRVTLTVTDDDDTTQSDTLYVEVSPGAEPGLSLSGPQQPTEGTTATYTANLDVGTAPLDYVVWTVDGTEIANRSLSAAQASDEATKRFPTVGTRTVTATVYDEDDQSATSSISVSVQQESETEEPDDESTSPGTTDPDRSIADDHDPTVTGDSVVTGARPLRGQYDVRLDASSDRIDSIEWRNVAERVGTGRSLARTWEPGDHELYAVVTYVDGSENVATFPDGTTTVTADPKPDVSIGSLDRWGAIVGYSGATDEYENLASLRVEVDGETVAVSRSTVRGRESLDTDRRRTLHFSHGDFVPGERYSVTFVATDSRGQTTEVSREIVPVKEPEIVRSEFVNSPVDSYHERIDPSRYAAKHVLEVDLNGVNPENVSVGVNGEGKVESIKQDGEDTESNYDPIDDIVSVKSTWVGKSPDSYSVEARYEVNIDESKWKGNEKDTFKVTPSKPEFRLDVLNDGTEDYITRKHGILVDASNSFDPDGTNLKYIWKYGANPTKPDNTTAKFYAYERAASIVEDQHDLRTRRNMDFLSYFIPDVKGAMTTTEGPYFPDETIRVRIETSAFHFSKQTYYDDFDLGLSVSNSKAELREWKLVETTDSGHSDAIEDAYRYVGIIEIPASELTPGSKEPTITVYNEENERKSEQIDFPNVNVLLEDKTYWTNTTIKNLSYTVEKPEIDEVMTESEEMRDAYLERGYSVEEHNQEIEHVLEERQKVRDAEYEKETKSFPSKQRRGVLLASSGDWYPGGTTQEEVTRTRTTTSWRSEDVAESRTKWYDGDQWNGEYTGASREVVVQEAKYQTQKQYRYEKQVEKTGTKTVTRTRTVRIPHTGTRTVTECIRGYGCRTVTTTYTYYTTTTQTYTLRRPYTYTETRTETYWAASGSVTHHEPTGKTRRVKVEDAVYETQYEIAQKEQYTDTVTRYVAARDELVQPAQYEWKERQSTTESMLAHRMATRDNWRIGEEVTETEWILSKRTGTDRFVTSQFQNESRVVETSAEVVGDRVQQYYNIDTGKKVTRTTETESTQETFAGARSQQQVLGEITGPEEKDDECKLKGIC